MAVLNYEWGRYLRGTVEYVTEDRAEEDLVSAIGTTVETAVEDFRNVHKLMKARKGHPTLFLLQSFSPSESKKAGPEALHQIGKELIDKLFPGHQAVIRTHTDKGHIHNHIVINTVHPVTGKRIINKYFENNGKFQNMKGEKRYFIHYMREVSDGICLEHGLSVINQKAVERRLKLPPQVLRMMRMKGNSWVLDLVQKIDVARQYSTNLPEFKSILSKFEIETNIEAKHINYLYPGETKPRRGKSLSSDYEREGLEKKFAENQKVFLSHPELRGALKNELDILFEGSGMRSISHSSSNVQDASSDHFVREKLPPPKDLSSRDEIRAHALLARSFATNFKQYADSLENAGIRVTYTKRTISYRHSSKERNVRGKTLGAAFDREDLEKAFAGNRKLFKSNPELRTKLAEEYALHLSETASRAPGGNAPEIGGKKSEVTKNMDVQNKVYPLRQKLDRRVYQDLVNKSLLARTVSTSQDEYFRVMKDLGIATTSEKGHLLYGHPAHQGAIRASELSPALDQRVLETRFRLNAMAVKSGTRLDSNGVRQELARAKTEANRLYGQKRVESLSLVKKLGMENQPPFQQGPVPEKGPSVSEKSGPHSQQPQNQLDHSMFPQNELSKARRSIPEYCKRNKIELTTNDKGEHRLKGRDYVVVHDFEWVNEKNGRKGSLIEFVAAHRNSTLVQAVAHINNSPRLLLLEKHLGAKEKLYTPFYIPKQDQMASGPQAVEKVGALLKSLGATSKMAQGLLARQQAQVSQSGSVRLFPKGSGSAALEFAHGMNNAWSERKFGKANAPFYSGATSGKEVHIFSDPKAFLKKYGEKVFAQNRDVPGVLSLMDTQSGHAVDQYLAQNKSVTKIFFSGASGKNLSKEELDFFNTMKANYSSLGIEVSEASLDRAPSLSGPELSL